MNESEALKIATRMLKWNVIGLKADLMYIENDPKEILAEIAEKEQAMIILKKMGEQFGVES